MAAGAAKSTIEREKGLKGEKGAKGDKGEEKGRAAESFEDLHVYQRARELINGIYTATRQGPFARDYRLVDQIRRAGGPSCLISPRGFEIVTDAFRPSHSSDPSHPSNSSATKKRLQCRQFRRKIHGLDWGFLERDRA